MLAGEPQTRRPELFAHFDEQLGVEAETPSRIEHAAQCGEVDAVLPLVVRGAASIPPSAVFGQLPWRAILAPLAVVTRDDVAVAVDQHRRQVVALEALGEEHRRRAG